MHALSALLCAGRHALLDDAFMADMLFSASQQRRGAGAVGRDGRQIGRHEAGELRSLLQVAASANSRAWSSCCLPASAIGEALHDGYGRRASHRRVQPGGDGVQHIDDLLARRRRQPAYKVALNEIGDALGIGQERDATVSSRSTRAPVTAMSLGHASTSISLSSSVACWRMSVERSRAHMASASRSTTGVQAAVGAASQLGADGDELVVARQLLDVCRQAMAQRAQERAVDGVGWCTASNTPTAGAITS